MTAAPRGPVTAFLLRAGLLTAALAIIAGIFGMHIMTGAHSMTGAHTMAGVATDTVLGHAHATPASHHGDGAELSSHTAIVAETVSGSSSCSTGGTCHEMSGMGAACVLSPGNTSFSAPLPGAARFGLPDFGVAAAANTNYSYSPGSPSPGELCISRT